MDSDYDKEKLLYDKSLDELLDIFYSDISFPTFYLDKIISYKLFEMLKKWTTTYNVVVHFDVISISCYTVEIVAPDGFTADILFIVV